MVSTCKQEESEEKVKKLTFGEELPVNLENKR